MNLQQLYSETVSPQLKEEFSIQNVHLIPKVSKVTVNVGLGEAVQNPKSIVYPELCKICSVKNVKLHLSVFCMNQDCLTV